MGPNPRISRQDRRNSVKLHDRCGGEISRLSKDWQLFICLKCATLTEDDGDPYEWPDGCSLSDALPTIKVWPPGIRLERPTGIPALGEIKRTTEL